MNKSWKVGDLLEFVWREGHSKAIPIGTKLLLFKRTVGRNNGSDKRWRIAWYGIRLDTSQEHKIIPSLNRAWEKVASLQSSAKT